MEVHKALVAINKYTKKIEAGQSKFSELKGQFERQLIQDDVIQNNSFVQIERPSF